MQHSALKVLGSADFRWLWFSQSLLSFSIQFYAVALVWLVLNQLGSAAQLGLILTVAALPRAAALLVSGAVLDRASGRTVMALAALGSGLLVGLIGLLLALDVFSLVLLLILSPLIGLLDAFIFPVGGALVPRLVGKEHLTAANGLMQTADSLANIFGPSLAGFAIEGLGLATALGLNSGALLIGALLASQMRALPPAQSETDMPHHNHTSHIGSILSSIRAGMAYAWENEVVRLALLTVAMLNFASIGPAVVGGAILVQERFNGSADLYGVLTSGYGFGALVGGVIAGLRAQVARPGRTLVWIGLFLGVGSIALGFAPDFWFAFAVNGLMGVGVGVGAVFAVAWLQSHTADLMQGRVSSLLMFSAMALDPLSNGVSGFVSEWSVTALFVGAGVLLIGLAGALLFQPTIHQVSIPASTAASSTANDQATA
jgi:MFS family permease